jgi:Family of unknown function (DUF6152)
MNGGNRTGAALAVLIALGAASTHAHHSFNDIFDVSTVTTLKGTISKIDWINPHVYINVDVKDVSGTVTTWGVESPPTNHLRSAGISRQDLWNDASAGEVVTVHVNPAKGDVKAERPLGLLMRITYADGHFFHVRGDPKEIAAAK